MDSEFYRYKKRNGESEGRLFYAARIFWALHTWLRAHATCSMWGITDISWTAACIRERVVCVR